MYNLARKGVASYIIVIFLVSIFMTVLLVFLLGTIYVEDPQECAGVDFGISNLCRTSKGIEFDVSNNADLLFKFKINDDLRPEFQIPPNTVKSIRYASDETIFRVVPIVGFSSEAKECNGKIANVKKEEVIKIC